MMVLVLEIMGMPNSKTAKYASIDAGTYVYNASKFPNASYPNIDPNKNKCLFRG